MAHDESKKDPTFLGTITLWNHYPRAHENRVKVSHPSLKKTRPAFMKAAFQNFLLLQILFLSLFAYIFGALYQETSRVKNLKILYVDYDGGAIGQSVRTAYESLQSDGFPRLYERTSAEYPAQADLQEAVCKADYWAAIYTIAGSSQVLQRAIADGSPTYDKTNIMKYIWNEARYSTIADSTISAEIQTLSVAATVIYASNNWTSILGTIPPASIPTFANPWTLADINIQPTTQGARLIYNTMVIVLILIQEFFYLGAINGLYEAFKIYTRLNPHRIIAFRFGISLAYTFLGSLCVAGTIWAFRADWHVNGNQFALTWAILWLFAHINFLVFDIFTIWMPASFVPMGLITWVIFNVGSILLPFELSPAFYRWAYAVPAHETYNTLIDIWSGGCNPKLYYALPILFSWEIVGLFCGALGVHRRCHYAMYRQDAEQEAFQKKIDVAMAFQRQVMGEKRAENRRNVMETEAGVESAEKIEEEDAEEDEKDREDLDRETLARQITREEAQLKKMQTKGSNVNFGPSFGFQFGHDDDN